MKKIKDYIIALFYSFRQILKFIFKDNNVMAGNLDPFYLGGALYIIDKIKHKDKNSILKLFLCFMPLFILATFQILLNEKISILKCFVNLAKIIICIMAMIYVKDNWKNFNYKKIIKCSIIILFILTLLAMIFNSSTYFWRFNDIVNKYNITRLQLFYLEPSELGFHIIILLIFIIGYFMIEKNQKQKFKLFLLVLMGLFVLYFAQPFGAIVCGSFALLSMILYKYFYVEKISKKNRILFSLVFIISISIIYAIMFFTKSSVLLRVLDTIDGVDASNSYRINTSIEILTNSFFKYKGLGCGFGNLNSASFLQQNGIYSVVANSFQYFIIEGGLLAIIILVLLILKLLKKSFNSKSVIKIGLFIFLISYQIFGGHFTSGLTWCLYGLILSNFNENNKEGEKE